MVEANRCLYCYDAPCAEACPTHIEIPRFIKQIASKNTRGAARTIFQANALGRSCSHVCPVEALCEGSCVYQAWQKKPIEIARLQRYATDRQISGNRPLFAPGQTLGKEIAVVGAGPAGLSCASYLRRLGYGVTIFEKRPLPGGLDTYGIAEYKLTQGAALEEIGMILELGIRLKSSIEIGRNISWEALEKNYDAVFIGVGLGKTQALGISGENLAGVWDALSFIERIKTRRFRNIEPSLSTVVIGAGNTAIDAVTQAKRLGATKVIMAYRRGPDAMSAYKHEYALAKHDGVEFLWNAAPVRILGRNKVEGIEFVRTESKSLGRGAPLKSISGSKFILPCDRIIKALGQIKQRSALEKIHGLKLDPSGCVAINPKTLQSSNPKYFAGGDAVNGGKEVVNAVEDGKRAAWAIHRYLGAGSQPDPEHRYWVSTIEGRRVAPPPERIHSYAQRKELAAV